MSYWEANGKSDEWYTPKYIFDAMGCGFDLDTAAPTEGPRHVPCDAWLHADALAASWRGFVWMNPPFGGRNEISPWLDKFFAHGNGVALTPDRTSAPWFQRAFRSSDAALFIAGKVKFERPDGSRGASPSNGTVLFAAGDQGVEALSRAEAAGLGCFCQCSRRYVK